MSQFFRDSLVWDDFEQSASSPEFIAATSGTANASREKRRARSYALLPYLHVVSVVHEVVGDNLSDLEEKKAEQTLLSAAKNLFLEVVKDSSDTAPAALRKSHNLVLAEINKYKEEHQALLRKKVSLLDQLLLLLTQLIPIISNDKRMMLFSGYTRVGLDIEKLEITVTELDHASPGIAPAA